MASVSEITLKYAAQGAKAAEKADKRVRGSVKETAKTARQESGEISRWMERHQAAILGIAAATTGAMAAIIQASPTLSAQLSNVRLGFSLLAMTIGEDVAPASEGLSEEVIDLAESYEEIPDPIRTAISYLVVFGSILGIAAIAAAGLQQILAGTLVAKGLTVLYGYLAGGMGILTGWVAALLGAGPIIGGVAAGTIAFAAAIGVVLGLLVVWILHITGVLDWIGELGTALAEELPGWATDGMIALIATFAGGLAILGAMIIGFMEGGFSGAIDRGKEMLDIFAGAFGRTGERAEEHLRDLGNWVLDWVGNAKDWGTDLISNFASSVINGAHRVVEGFKQLGEDAAGTFVDRFNKIVPDSLTLPSVTLSAPDWAGGGSTTIGGQTLNIPQLASGGLVTGPTLAMVGEGSSDEAVIPLDRWDEFAGGGEGGNTTIEIIFEAGSIVVEGGSDGGIDPRQLARDIKREIRSDLGSQGGI